MNYATFHPDGTLNQRLIKGTHVIPEDAIEIDAALWQKLICDAGGIWRARYCLAVHLHHRTGRHVHARRYGQRAAQ